MLEASSQSLKQHRTEGICFDYGIFLNLYPDHLRREEHLDMEEYFFWKASLLKASKHRFCCASLKNKIKYLSGRSSLMPIITFGKEAFSDYRLLTAPLCAGNLFEGRNIYILYPAGTRKRRQAFYTSLFGSFQAENILAAFCCTREMGVSIFHQKEVFQTCQIPGRGEILSVKPFSVILDYAHNGESLQRLLTSIRPFCPGRLICVFGCGGNRSPQRRFDMGRISGLYADHTIFTEDNPRYEDPDHIFQDLVRGILPTKGSYQIIESRKKAVLQAICQAQPGDCLVFAGKGSETYIERRGVREPYCEREYIHALLSSEC